MLVATIISLICFPFQFLSAPFHTETFPMVPFCVALRMLRASRCSAVNCSVTKVMSTPFLSPASCVIPRRKTGLMMLHCLTPAKVKATHTLFYLPVEMLTGCCNISFWDLHFYEVLLLYLLSVCVVMMSIRASGIADSAGVLRATDVPG